jgi:hypothetical protein
MEFGEYFGTQRNLLRYFENTALREEITLFETDEIQMCMP